MLRRNYEQVRDLSLEQQLEDCIEQLSYPEVFVGEIAAAHAALAPKIVEGWPHDTLFPPPGLPTLSWLWPPAAATSRARFAAARTKSLIPSPERSPRDLLRTMRSQTRRGIHDKLDRVVYSPPEVGEQWQCFEISGSARNLLWDRVFAIPWDKTTRRECAIALKRSNIIEQSGARGGRFTHHYRRTAIKRQHNAAFTTQGLEHGQDPIQLLLLRYQRRTGSCGLTANIENFCAGINHGKGLAT